MFSVVLAFRRIVCFVVTPARKLVGIKHMSQQVYSKKNNHCATIENELALLETLLCFHYTFVEVASQGPNWE